MAKHDKVFWFVGTVIAVATLLFWRYAVLSSWGEVLMIHLLFVTALGVMGAAAAAITWVLYQITIVRTLRYARELRAAGFAVQFDQQLIWQFAGTLLLGIAMSSVAVWLTRVTWDNYWHYAQLDIMWLLTVGLMWLIGLGALSGAVGLWITSFRPIRELHKELRLRLQPDTPRLDG